MVQSGYGVRLLRGFWVHWQMPVLGIWPETGRSLSVALSLL